MNQLAWAWAARVSALMGMVVLGCGSDVDIGGALDGSVERDGAAEGDGGTAVDGGPEADASASRDGGGHLDSALDPDGGSSMDGGEPCIAIVESCNGDDDDCDGRTDEDADASCTFAMGTGVCADGECELDSCSEGADDCDDDPTNGCEPLGTFYADMDMDDVGDPSEPRPACEMPIGTVANDDDCYDTNDDARPGQTMYFVPQRGDGRWDYDCNGTDDRQWTNLGVCELAAGGCSFSAGWFGVDGIPGCGGGGGYLEGCRLLEGRCVPVATERSQRCR